MRWLLPIALAAGAPPALQLPQKPATPPPPAATPTPQDMVDLTDVQSRMSVPVAIGDKGPYPFLVDTGAERSVVSRELAGVLGLAPGRRVHVTTMAGAGELGTFVLPALRVSSVKAATIEAPAVDARNLGAPGMLGIDALRGHAVSIDFDRNVMAVSPSTRRRIPAGPDDIVVRAKNVFGQLIVTDAHYRGQRISVVIDTGSPVTIGNLAMLRKVKIEQSLGMIALLSVTGQYLQADYRVIDRLDIAGVGFHTVPIAFADALPFKRFGLLDSPALMLGMDTLKLFRRVQIDFANREIRLTLPKSAVEQPRPYGF